MDALGANFRSAPVIYGQERQQVRVRRCSGSERDHINNIIKGLYFIFYIFSLK